MNFRLYLFAFILILISRVESVSQCYECNPCPANERTVKCPDSSYVVNFWLFLLFSNESNFNIYLSSLSFIKCYSLRDGSSNVISRGCTTSNGCVQDSIGKRFYDCCSQDLCNKSIVKNSSNKRSIIVNSILIPFSQIIVALLAAFK